MKEYLEKEEQKLQSKLSIRIKNLRLESNKNQDGIARYLEYYKLKEIDVKKRKLEGYMSFEVTNNIVKEDIEKKIGMNYDEFMALDFEEQQKIIHKQHKRPKIGRRILQMIGSGENALFVTVRKGEKIFVTSGDETIIVEAGLTPQEAQKRMEKRYKKVLRRSSRMWVFLVEFIKIIGRL